MGVGSVLGALAAGARGRVDSRLLVWAAAAFGVLMLAAAAAPTLPLRIAALVPLGDGHRDLHRGRELDASARGRPGDARRVMALYSVVFLGSTPIGAPLVGWLAGTLGPRAGLVLGARGGAVGCLRRPGRVRAGRRAGRALDRHALRRRASRARVAALSLSGRRG